jgi:hypothetical protein
MRPRILPVISEQSGIRRFKTNSVGCLSSVPTTTHSPNVKAFKVIEGRHFDARASTYPDPVHFLNLNADDTSGALKKLEATLYSRSAYLWYITATNRHCLYRVAARDA